MSKRSSSRKQPPRRRLVVRLAGAAGAGLIAHPVPVLAIVGGAAAFGAVYANVALLQPGKHPAPLFTTRRTSRAGRIARPRGPSSASAGASATPANAGRSALVRDIQAALADRGYEVGSATGATRRLDDHCDPRLRVGAGAAADRRTERGAARPRPHRRAADGPTAARLRTVAVATSSASSARSPISATARSRSTAGSAARPRARSAAFAPTTACRRAIRSIPSWFRP